MVRKITISGQLNSSELLVKIGRKEPEDWEKDKFSKLDKIYESNIEKLLKNIKKKEEVFLNNLRNGCLTLNEKVSRQINISDLQKVKISIIFELSGQTQLLFISNKKFKYGHISFYDWGTLAYTDSGFYEEAKELLDDLTLTRKHGDEKYELEDYEEIQFDFNTSFSLIEKSIKNNRDYIQEFTRSCSHIIQRLLESKMILDSFLNDLNKIRVADLKRKSTKQIFQYFNTDDYQIEEGV